MGMLISGGAWLWDNMFGYAKPAEPWMWIFTVGWIFAMLSTKKIRSRTHWIGYLVLWPLVLVVRIVLWLVNKVVLIPKVNPGKWTLDGYKKVMDSELQPNWTVREATIGALGCCAIAGVAGGKWATGGNWWLWIGFVPIGVYGLYSLVMFIAKSVNKEKGEDAVKKASKDAAKKIWAKVKPKSVTTKPAPKTLPVKGQTTPVGQSASTPTKSQPKKKGGGSKGSMDPKNDY